jgi:RNA polymerase sigma factor (TIGR02999 family)
MQIDEIAMSEQECITQLLLDWNNGDATALNRLMPLVEAELRRVAHYHMRNEGIDHTLQTTALVHEAYLKLVDQRKANWQDRAHFFGVAAKVMRRILVDYARRNSRHKRGGGEKDLPLDEVIHITAEKSAELLALDEALLRLAAQDPLKSQIVELRHFGGLTVEETAEFLKIAPITVIRHWKFAKAWLRLEVRGE